MKLETSTQRRKFQNGIILPVIAGSIFAILAISFIIVAMANAFQTRQALQNITDVAALVSANRIRQTSQITANSIRSEIFDLACQHVQMNSRINRVELKPVNTVIPSSTYIHKCTYGDVVIQDITPGVGTVSYVSTISISARALSQNFILQNLPFFQEKTTVSAYSKAKIRPVALSLALDYSVSMLSALGSPGQSKLTALQNSMQGFINHFIPGLDYIGGVWFGGDAEVFRALSVLGTTDNDSSVGGSFMNYIKIMHPRNSWTDPHTGIVHSGIGQTGTNISRGLRFAATMVTPDNVYSSAHVGAPPETLRIAVLLTDGSPHLFEKSVDYQIGPGGAPVRSRDEALHSLEYTYNGALYESLKPDRKLNRCSVSSDSSQILTVASSIGTKTFPASSAYAGVRYSDTYKDLVARFGFLDTAAEKPIVFPSDRNSVLNWFSWARIWEDFQNPFYYLNAINIADAARDNGTVVMTIGLGLPPTETLGTTAWRDPQGPPAAAICTSSKYVQRPACAPDTLTTVTREFRRDECHTEPCISNFTDNYFDVSIRGCNCAGSGTLPNFKTDPFQCICSWNPDQDSPVRENFLRRVAWDMELPDGTIVPQFPCTDEGFDSAGTDVHYASIVKGKFQLADDTSKLNNVYEMIADQLQAVLAR